MRPRIRTGGVSGAARTGGVRLGPLWLVLPCAFFLGFTLRSLRSGERVGLDAETLGRREASRVPDVRAGADVDGFAAEATLAGSRVQVRLAPLEAAPAAQAFVAERWGERLGLEAGEPWRVDVVHAEGAAPLDLTDLRVEDAEGLALHRPVLIDGTRDPRAVLLLARDEPLDVGQRRELVLWGRPPGADARLVLGQTDGADEELTLEAAHFEPGELPRWLAAPDADGGADTSGGSNPATSGAGGAKPEASGEDGDQARVQAVADGQGELAALDQDALRERVRALEQELELLRTRRVERELAWYHYNRALADLDIDAIVAAFAVDEALLDEEGLLAEEAGPELPGEDDARTERDRDLERGVRTLLALEGFSGLDLLQLGPALEGGGAGPAVFRMLDDRGRLIGSLNADRLRLEASRSARTITIVLEDGFESRGGRRTPFTNGARRLLIPYVDPVPYVDALPELFPPEALEVVSDDGLWPLETLRRELNGLLALDTSSGWWRLHGLGGVTGAVLRDVQLEQLGDEGTVRRRVFADRLRILIDDPGVLLVLEDGAIVRGQDKTPFVDGSYRLFLPRAPLSEWRAADLPGADAPPAEADADGLPEDDAR